VKKGIRLTGDQEVEIRASGEQQEKGELINLIFWYPDVHSLIS
jgi:hypothetical protein